MTFVSLTQATTRLGIDAKTLHRWLGEAQLPLQAHPRDGRKKGLSDEHLQTLARLHQRSLAPLQEEPPALSASEGPPLPVALLALPEQVSALHAQIAALQQQVAALTHLLQQHGPEPARPAAPPTPPRAGKRPPKPASPAPPPAKPVHVLPRVEYVSEGHYVVICPTQGLLAVEPDSPAWFRWLMTLDSFRFVGRSGHFTAHHESARVLRGAWRAQRKIRNHLYNVRLAPSHQLTIAVLEQAATALQAHLAQLLTGGSLSAELPRWAPPTLLEKKCHCSVISLFQSQTRCQAASHIHLVGLEVQISWFQSQTRCQAASHRYVNNGTGN